MTLDQARKELHKISGDKYTSVKIEVMGYAKTPNERKVICSCYVADYGWSADCASFEDALYQIAQKMNGIDHPDRSEKLLMTTVAAASSEGGDQSGD